MPGTIALNNGLVNSAKATVDALNSVQGGASSSSQGNSLFDQFLSDVEQAKKAQETLHSSEWLINNPAWTDGSYQFGDILGGGSAAKAQAQAQAELDYAEFVRNNYSASQQRAWEEYMSNTQVQRAMKDIEAAGLNPWLAVQSANFGGSVPSGASASSSSGQAAAGDGAGKSLMALSATAYGIVRIIKAIAKAMK